MMTPMRFEKDLPILVVEDNDEDYEALKRVFGRVGLDDKIYRCCDGDEAVDFLFARGRYAGASAPPRPGLVLLDLNLPGIDGREVLTQIKSNEATRQIPVLVLTTSGLQRDIEECYAVGANTYFCKPGDPKEFDELIRLINDYWLNRASIADDPK